MCLVFQSHTLEQLGVSKDVRVTSYHGMFEENLKKHLSNKMLGVYVFEHFESFRSIQFEFGKTGRIQIGYSGCTSSQASSNTSEHYSIRGVHRSVFGRIRARIFGFLRSDSLLNIQLRFLNSTKRNHTKRHAKIQYGRFLLDTHRRLHPQALSHFLSRLRPQALSQKTT